MGHFAVCLLALTSIALMPGFTHGAKILLYPFGHCFNSHLLNFERMGQILEDDGHDVTMIINSNYYDFIPAGAEAKNVTAGGGDRTGGMDLIVFEAPANFTPICEYDTIDWMLNTPISLRFNGFIETTRRYCENIVSNTRIMKQLKEAKFDLFIPEALDPCSRILADYVDVKFIPLITTGLGHFDNNPRPPSYVPAAIAPFTPHMSFLQRLGNFLMKALYDSMPIIVGFDAAFEQLKIKYQLNTSLSLAHTMHRASLKLVNSDFTIEYPAPIEPDTILIGGFNIKTPQPLDLTMQRFMDSAEDGVVVFSFGTLVKSFDDKWARLFIDAFSRLPQKVLWRAVGLENTTLGSNSNILALPWLPQNDILAHPKTKLLITHCGLNSAMEAATFGVPVIALPMSGDHFAHASKLTDHAGMGLTLDIASLTSDKLYNAITTVIKEPSYKNNAKRMAQKIADQPMSQTEKILFWVSYILRHDGSHFKSVAHKLTWFQYFSLDVILTLVAGVAGIMSLAIMIAIKIIQKIWHVIKMPDKQKIY
jgi:UDP:flavonoid glycosyltransferase YjiC (YdhE family)